MLEDLLEISHDLIVIRIHLGADEVHFLPPMRIRPFDQAEILRRKGDGGDQSFEALDRTPFAIQLISSLPLHEEEVDIQKPIPISDLR